MHELVERHIRRLRLLCTAMLASLGVYAAVVLAVPLQTPPALPQGEPLMWGFAFLAAVNLVTIMPVYRAMLDAPRRVYTVGHQPERLLAAHLTAHLVAFARLEAVSIMGLVLDFLTGRLDWFWIFTGVAAAGMAVLWPRREKVAALVVVPGEGALDIAAER
jgi:hypothetical protein